MVPAVFLTPQKQGPQTHLHRVPISNRYAQPDGLCACRTQLFPVTAQTAAQMQPGQQSHQGNCPPASSPPSSPVSKADALSQTPSACWSGPTLGTTAGNHWNTWDTSETSKSSAASCSLAQFSWGSPPTSFWLRGSSTQLKLLPARDKCVWTFTNTISHLYPQPHIHGLKMFRYISIKHRHFPCHYSFNNRA